jgi:hypothetical protein
LGEIESRQSFLFRVLANSDWQPALA